MTLYQITVKSSCLRCLISILPSFYRKISKGGKHSKLENGKGIRTDLKDGTTITLREVSKSDGTPSMQIRISQAIQTPSGIKIVSPKIHFVERRKQ